MHSPYYFFLGHCLEILSTVQEEQMIEVWTYFNLEFSDKYVYTRCVECNGNCFISIPQKITLILAHNLAKRKKKGSAGPLPFPGKQTSSEIENNFHKLGLGQTNADDSRIFQPCTRDGASQKFGNDYTIESDWFITRFGH